MIAGIAHDVLVMYAGRSVELGSAEDVLTSPHHPYSAGLLASAPGLTGDVDLPLKPVPGNPPSLLAVPGGCAFHPRCEARSQLPDDRCTLDRPSLTGEDGHLAACHLSGRQRASLRAAQGTQESTR